MRGLHALRAERGQLLLTASAHASAYPPGRFYDIGKYELSYIRTETLISICIKLIAPFITNRYEGFYHCINPARTTLATRPAAVANSAPGNVNLVLVTFAVIKYTLMV